MIYGREDKYQISVFLSIAKNAVFVGWRCPKVDSTSSQIYGPS